MKFDFTLKIVISSKCHKHINNKNQSQIVGQVQKTNLRVELFWKSIMNKCCKFNLIRKSKECELLINPGKGNKEQIVCNKQADMETSLLLFYVMVIFHELREYQFIILKKSLSQFSYNPSVKNEELFLLSY